MIADFNVRLLDWKISIWHWCVELTTKVMITAWQWLPLKWSEWLVFEFVSIMIGVRQSTTRTRNPFLWQWMSLGRTGRRNTLKLFFSFKRHKTLTNDAITMTINAKKCEFLHLCVTFVLLINTTQMKSYVVVELMLIRLNFLRNEILSWSLQQLWCPALFATADCSAIVDNFLLFSEQLNNSTSKSFSKDARENSSGHEVASRTCLIISLVTLEEFWNISKLQLGSEMLSFAAFG